MMTLLLTIQIPMKLAMVMSQLVVTELISEHHLTWMKMQVTVMAETQAVRMEMSQMVNRISIHRLSIVNLEQYEKAGASCLGFLFFGEIKAQIEIGHVLECKSR